MRNSNKDLRQTGCKLRSCSTSLFIPNIIITALIAFATLASGTFAVFDRKAHRLEFDRGDLGWRWHDGSIDAGAGHPWLSLGAGMQTLSRRTVEQYILEPQFTFQPPIRVKTLRWAATKTFWEILELPFRDAAHQLLLLISKTIGRYAIEPHTKYVDRDPLIDKYQKIHRIDLEDVILNTAAIVREYQLRTSRRPTLICMGSGTYADFAHSVHTQFATDYSSDLHYRDRTGDHRVDTWFRGMRVVICPDINGIVILGEDELEPRRT